MFGRRQFHLHVGIVLRLGNLLMGELAAGHRIDALDALGHVLVGDPLHFEHMHAAEIGNLLKGDRGVVDQPDGCRFGHQGRVGHGLFLFVRGFSGPHAALKDSPIEEGPFLARKRGERKENLYGSSKIFPI